MMNTDLARAHLKENGWKLSAVRADGTWVAVASVVALIACVQLDFEFRYADGNATLTGTRKEADGARVVERSGPLMAMAEMAVDVKFRAEHA